MKLVKIKKRNELRREEFIMRLLEQEELNQSTSSLFSDTAYPVQIMNLTEVVKQGFFVCGMRYHFLYKIHAKPGSNADDADCINPQIAWSLFIKILGKPYTAIWQYHRF